MAIPAVSASAALVRVSGPDEDGERTQGRPFFDHRNGVTQLSCSGLVVCMKRRWVVVPVALLTPFLTWDIKGSQVLVEGADVDVLLCGMRRYISAKLIKIVDAEAYRTCMSQLATSSQWKCGWTSSDGLRMPCTDLNDIGLASTPSNMAVSGIAVLQFANTDFPNDITAICADTSSHPKRGTPLISVTSPFGLVATSVFRNTLGSCVISNLLPSDGDRAHLIIADMRTVPGAEGGGIFDNGGKCVGMIMPPLSHGEHPIEFSVVIPARDLLEAIGVREGELALAPAVAINRQEEEKEELSSVVLVVVSQTWASGVILSSSGYIVTNAHVVRPFLLPPTPGHPPRLQPGVSLRIRLNDAALTWLPSADVIFVSTSHWDIALLKVTSPLPENIKLRPAVHVDEVRVPTVAGTPIFAVGHGIFPAGSRMRASLTAGRVGRCVEAAGVGVLLHCDPVINQGSSGGALFEQESGRFIGLIVSNARHNASKVIPRVNFSLPASILLPLLDYIETHDASLLALYNESDAETSAVWQPSSAPFATFQKTRLAKYLRGKVGVKSKL